MHRECRGSGSGRSSDEREPTRRPENPENGIERRERANVYVSDVRLTGPMHSERRRGELCPRLGLCPRCEGAIPVESLLAEYHHPGEWPRLLAECPDCDAVVAPR